MQNPRLGCRSHRRRRAAAIRHAIHASNADLFTAPRLGGLNVLIDHLTPRCTEDSTVQGRVRSTGSAHLATLLPPRTSSVTFRAFP